jgi:hypothetical protein
MARARVVTGAHVFLYINGKPYCRVSAFNWDSSTPSKPIEGIDEVEEIELAPTRARCSIMMSLYRLIGDGGIQGPGIAPPVENLPRGKYISMMLIDRVSDTVLFQADHCRVDRESWNAATKQLVTGSVQLRALSWNNEVRPLHHA